jgi:hypothetical protein
MVCSRRLSLFVFIDALGWELSQRHAFLDGLTTVRSPLATIFGYSSTCDPTILTGKLPREHGHFAFFTYNPAQSPFRHYRMLRVLPKSIMDRGRIRGKLSRVMKRFHGYTGYFQLYNMPFEHLHLFDYSEKRSLFEPGGINSGAPTIFDVLREHGIPFSRSESFSETASIARLEAGIDRGEVTFAYLFFGALDGVLHAQGTRASAVSEHIRWYEERLTRLVDRAARQYEAVRLFVFSDHGMTDITGTCDLMRRIDRLGLRFGVDYAAVYDSTMARFWFLTGTARERIEAALREEPQGRILSEEQLAEWGCDFPHHEYGELFFLLHPGVLLCPSFMGARPLAAMHGYEPQDQDSVACFLSNVPVAPLPRRLEDLYDVMRREALQGRGAQ